MIMDMEDYRQLRKLIRHSTTDAVLRYIRCSNISAETFDQVSKTSTGSSPLGLAIQHGHLRVVNELIKLGFDPNSPCRVNNAVLSPLSSACKYNKLDIVLSLLHDHGIDIDSFDAEGYTALVATIKYNSSVEMVDTVKTLVDAGASVNISCRRGRRTPLSAAIDKHSVSIDLCRYLISKGADVNARGKHNTSPLMRAIERCVSTDVLRLLIESGADVNVSNKDKETVVMYAIKKKAGIDVIRLLLQYRPDVNTLDTNSKSPLCYAIENIYESKQGGNETVKALVKSGADVNISYSEHRSLLLHVIAKSARTDVIAKSARTDMIKLLVEAGADVNGSDSNNGKSALLYAMTTREGIDNDVVNILLESGADVNMVDKHKKSPLHFALENHMLSNCTLNIVTYLIKYGADVNVLDIENVSPLMHAVRVADNTNYHKTAIAIVQLLVDSGADVNIQDENGDTPLMYALKQKARVTLMLLLLESGADVCVHNRDNMCALDLIMKNFSKFNRAFNKYGGLVNLFVTSAGNLKGHLVTLPTTKRFHDAFDMIRALCSKGADIECKDETGNTVLHQVMFRISECCCAKCFNLVHFLIVQLNLSIWTLNSANKTPFHCVMNTNYFPDEEMEETYFRRGIACKILKLCFQVGYTPDSDEMLVVREIEEQYSTVIYKGSEVTSLQDICCFSVRRALGRRLPTAVDSLHIPEKLKQRVKLTHILPMEETPENTVDIAIYDYLFTGDNDDDEYEYEDQYDDSEWDEEAFYWYEYI